MQQKNGEWGLTTWKSLGICRPKQRRGRSIHSQHDWEECADEKIGEGSRAGGTHGAMITLAPGCGKVPTPSIGSSTWLSHPSSWYESVGSWSEYHDPAWLAALIVIGAVM